MYEIVVLLVIGAVTGTLAGLLGIGGGIILVPILLWVLQNHPNIAQANIMQIALATSLTTIIFTALSSIRAHHKRKAIEWAVVKKFAPGMIIGTISGVFIASLLSNEILKIIFSIFLIIIAIQLFLGLVPSGKMGIPNAFETNLIGSGIGCLSALVGIAGGSLTVPLLLWFKIPLRNAIATSAACGLPISAAGAIGYFLLGLKNGQDFSSGYIYWPAVISLVPTSLLFAPLGAKLAHTLPVGHLKRIFAVLLAFISIKMFLSTHFMSAYLA